MRSSGYLDEKPIGFHETMISAYLSTRRQVHEKCNLHINFRDNLKFYRIYTLIYVPKKTSEHIIRCFQFITAIIYTEDAKIPITYA